MGLRITDVMPRRQYNRLTARKRERVRKLLHEYNKRSIDTDRLGEVFGELFKIAKKSAEERTTSC